MTDSLLLKLTQADVVCRDCGMKYGKYSVGCSSMWEGECDVCGERKAITEVRDWGYLGKGIQELRGDIKEQSKEVADYMKSVGPIMNDDELEDALLPSYEQGEITLKLTDDEVSVLAELVDDPGENYRPGADVVFDSLFVKVKDLYDDNCVKYELSPALKAYNAKYGTWGTGEDEQRWEGFRDAYELLNPN